MFSIPLLGTRLRTRAYSSRPMFFIPGRAVLRGGQSVQHWIKIRPVFFIAGRAALLGGQVVQHWIKLGIQSAESAGHNGLDETRKRPKRAILSRPPFHGTM